MLFDLLTSVLPDPTSSGGYSEHCARAAREKPAASPKPRNFLDPALLISSGAVEPFHQTRWQRLVRAVRALFNRSAN